MSDELASALPDDFESDTATGSRPMLWSGDTGLLPDSSRRALLLLLKGPYLSGTERPKSWAALLADERAIRSRLHELFLDLVIDRDDEFAFVRKALTPEFEAPATVRTMSLTFLDTAMLLVLRQTMLAAHGERRVIVGKDEIFDQLRMFDTSTDVVGFDKRLNASWSNMLNRLRVVHTSGSGDERVELSPVLKLLVDDDRVRALEAEYRRIVASDAPEAVELDLEWSDR
jgi:hypothetical protein